MSNDSSQDIQAILSQSQTIDPNDPDAMAKLNELALKVAEAQGKTVQTNTNNAQVDPMDELGCEGCQ